MSLLGVDVGTSALKVAAYCEDGRLIASVRVPVSPSYPRPGWSELAPQDVWRAAQTGLAKITSIPELRRDPPIALAISASGDEVFPVDAHGEPLAPCILSGDTRGYDLEVDTANRASPGEWYKLCGHIPERMDPVNRIRWWCVHEPAVISKTSRFFGWHEYLTFHLTGTAATDPSLAAKWAIYDRERQEWSNDWIHRLGLTAEWLPQIQTWGNAIGEVRSAFRKSWDVSNQVTVGVGAFDSTCAALGAGVSRAGVVGLACGSWEVVTAPTDLHSLMPSLLDAQLPLAPYPGETAFAILAQSPNGSAVIDWGVQLLRQDLADLSAEIEASGPQPSPILAIPHFSGAINPRAGGRDSRAAFLGLTLASTGADMLKALMESVAYDLTLTLRVMAESDIPCEVLRATGGGTKSDWWMQLKADLSGTPVEVVAQPESGTFGAALLAGTAAGVYEVAGKAAEATVQVNRRYEPVSHRRNLYTSRLGTYSETISALLPTHRRLSDAHA